MKYNKCDSEIILKPTHLDKYFSWNISTLSSAPSVTKIVYAMLEWVNCKNVKFVRVLFYHNNFSESVR